MGRDRGSGTDTVTSRVLIFKHEVWNFRSKRDSMTLGVKRPWRLDLEVEYHMDGK